MRITKGMGGTHFKKTDKSKFKIVDRKKFQNVKILIDDDNCVDYNTVINKINFIPSIKKRFKNCNEISEKAKYKKKAILNSLEKNTVMYKIKDGKVIYNRGDEKVEWLNSLEDSFDGTLEKEENKYFKDTELFATLQKINKSSTLAELQKYNSENEEGNKYYKYEVKAYIKTIFSKSREVEKKRLENNFIKKAVRSRLKNKITQHMINRGKLIEYFYEEKWNKTDFSSADFERIKMIEASKKQLLNCVFYATKKLIYLSNYEEKKDILHNNNLNNINIKKYKIQTLFSKVEDFNFEFLQKTVKNLRNNTYHFKKESLVKVLENQMDNTFFKGNLELDIDIVNIKFKEKIKSMNIPIYYDFNTIKDLLQESNFSIQPTIIPFAPSFNNVFKKGQNLQKSKNGLIDKNDWYLTFDKKEEELIYKNVLQLLYKNIFIPEIKNNEGWILDNINTIIEQNKQNKKNKKYKYAIIEEINADKKATNLQEWFANLQSQVHTKITKDKEERTNVYIDFVRDLFTYSFNAFLGEKFGKIKETLIKPVKRDENENELNKIKMEITHDLKHEDINIGVYAFLKLLDNKNLNLLKGQFEKYYNINKDNNILKYCELINLIILTKPVINLIENGESKEAYEDLIKNFYKDNYKECVDLYVQSNKETIIPRKSLLKIEQECVSNLYKDIFSDLKVNKDNYNEFINIKDESIAKLQEETAILHNKLVLGDSNEFKKYKQNIMEISNYNYLFSKVTFHNLKMLEQIHTEILGRLIGFVNDFERDFKFILKYLEYIEKVEFSNCKFASVDEMFENGMLGKKWNEFKNNEKNCENILTKFFFQIKEFNWTETRNDIAHYHHLTTTKKSLIELINDVRKLMNYDNKRKNAVMKSIIDILKKNGIIAKFEFKNNNFNLRELKSDKIIHLKKCTKEKISIDKHDKEFVDMLKALLEFKKKN